MTTHAWSTGGEFALLPLCYEAAVRAGESPPTLAGGMRISGDDAEIDCRKCRSLVHA